MHVNWRLVFPVSLLTSGVLAQCGCVEPHEQAHARALAPGAREAPTPDDARDDVLDDSRADAGPGARDTRVFARSWEMPAVGADAPAFAPLPGEDPRRSRSIGDVSSGYLINAHQLRFPHRHIAILDVQARRHLNFTSDEMVDLLEASAAHVDAKFPGATTYIGNLGRRGGGDIIYSVSHNSGRDADVAFFVTDEAGQPAVMPTLLPLDEQGRYEGEHGVFVFDVPKNWALVEGFLRWGGDGKIQFIFVADWLRDQLIEYATAQGFDPAVIAKARALMRQPRATLPHNDHFHLRIFCSADDVAAGCRNTGSKPPGFDAHSSAKATTAVRARMALRHEDPVFRRAGLERLVVLGERSSSKSVEKLLVDPDPLVRAAAARALAEFDRGSRAMITALGLEQHPHVRVELVDALARAGDRRSIEALAALLSQPQPVELEHGAVDVRLFVVDALGKLESELPVPALIDVLEESRDVELLDRTARALGYLTNHRFLVDWELASEPERLLAAQEWRAWYKENRREKRTGWLLAGFQRAGFDVKALSGRFVWDICRAISSDRYLSYNAQRALMKLSKHKPASLDWSHADASFYWRRWFERRRRRFGAPPVPPELSTLKPKK